MNRTLSNHHRIPLAQPLVSAQNHSAITHFLILLLVFAFAITINYQAKADYKIYLENRLGSDKHVNDFYASLMTTKGVDVLAAIPVITMDPLEDELLLVSKVNSPTLTLVDRSLSFTYSCASGGFDCWPSDSLPMSIPLSPMYCDLLGNHAIDTADKTFGTGQNAVTYKTRYIKFTLNSDFTVSYSIVRKSSDGFISYERLNLSMEIGRSRCSWAL